MAYTIDDMKEADWPQVSLIYLTGIQTHVATFDSDVPTFEEWDRTHHRPCRLVARHGDAVLGWAALSPVSIRSAYRGVAEVSIYVARGSAGQGIGTALLKELIKRSEESGCWTLQSAIIVENAASRRLHERCGFKQVGVRERIGRTDDGKWHDVILMERRSARVCADG